MYHKMIFYAAIQYCVKSTGSLPHNITCIIVLHASFLTFAATLNSVWSFTHTDPAIMLIGGEEGLGPVTVLLLLYPAILCEKICGSIKNIM